MPGINANHNQRMHALFEIVSGSDERRFDHVRVCCVHAYVIRRVRASLMMCEKRTECDVEEKNTKRANGTSVSRHARLVPAKTNRNALAQLLLGEITLLH